MKFIILLPGLSSYYLSPVIFLLTSCAHPTARGDRMKQAQADADELIAAYRREQQDAFDKKVAMEGKFFHSITHVLSR